MRNWIVDHMPRRLSRALGIIRPTDVFRWTDEAHAAFVAEIDRVGALARQAISIDGGQ